MPDVKEDKSTILIVDNSPGITGAVKSMTSVAAALRDHYSFVFVVPLRSSAVPYVRKNGFVCIEMPFLELKKSIKVLLYFPMLLINALRMRNIARRFNVCLIHVNDIYNLTGVVVRILMPSIRLVYHVRLLSSSYAKTLYRFWAKLVDRYADAVVACSQHVKDDLKLGDHRVSLIYDAIPLEERYPPKLQLRDSNDGLNILYLAHFIQGKGQDDALEAFHRVYTSKRNLRLTFVGGDLGLPKNRKFKRQLENRVAALGLSKAVRFLPVQADVEKLVKDADIMLNFSKSESFSMTCLEALFYGTPLIATDCGGPAEIIDPGVTGMLVPVGDVSAMSGAIMTLSEDQRLREDFSRAGRAAVRKKFILYKSAESLKALYTKLLKFEG